jgi:hypothetical protein
VATSIVEGLNVLDVLTADRIVARISIEHPAEGYVPSVTLDGTLFENLRINGTLIDLDVDLNLLGARPSDDTSYLIAPGFRQRVQSQYDTIHGQPGVPTEILARYNQLPSGQGDQELIECSLVRHVQGSPSGRSFGHVIVVPNFGKVYLATLRAEHSDLNPATTTPQKTQLNLKMLELHLGSPATGQAHVSSLVVNGGTQP